MCTVTYPTAIAMFLVTHSLRVLLQKFAHVSLFPFLMLRGLLQVTYTLSLAVHTVTHQPSSVVSQTRPCRKIPFPGTTAFSSTHFNHPRCHLLGWLRARLSLTICVKIRVVFFPNAIHQPSRRLSNSISRMHTHVPRDTCPFSTVVQNLPSSQN
jgi:hypothetical protein